MSLTSYQQAVLQEMGITVWVTKKAYEEQKSDSTVAEVNNRAALIQASQAQVTERSQAKPITQKEKQSKLAQLRAQMGAEQNQRRSLISRQSKPQFQHLQMHKHTAALQSRKTFLYLPKAFL